MDLDALYHAAWTTDSDIRGHVPTFADACIELDAANVIELGVRTGVSTIGWLYGLASTGGWLYSVDVHPHKSPLVSDVSNGWTFVLGNDLDANVVSQLPDVVDIVFIDTSHTYDQTLAELALYVPRVREGGRVYLHDTELERPESIGRDDQPYPVKRALDLYCMANGLKWSNNPACYGLGLIQL